MAFLYNPLLERCLYSVPVDFLEDVADIGTKLQGLQVSTAALDRINWAKDVSFHPPEASSDASWCLIKAPHNLEYASRSLSISSVSQDGSAYRWQLSHRILRAPTSP